MRKLVIGVNTLFVCYIIWLVHYDIANAPLYSLTILLVAVVPLAIVWPAKRPGVAAWFAIWTIAILEFSSIILLLIAAAAASPTGHSRVDFSAFLFLVPIVLNIVYLCSLSPGHEE